LSIAIRCLTNVFQEWMGEFFVKTTLYDIGATYQLGHPIGNDCPFPSSPMDLTLFNISGVTTVRIQYCYCGDIGEQPPPRVQLLHARWFPATLKQPSTIFSFWLLDFIHKLQTQSKVNPDDLCATITAIRNASGLASPIVGSRRCHSPMRLTPFHLVPLQRTHIGNSPLGGLTSCSPWRQCTYGQPSR
jgi:hypothetical protein